VLRLKVFGGLSIERDQGPAEGAGAQRRRLALLALLDGAGDRGLTRDKILGFLWPESEPEKARRILTQALYALRRDLREEELFLGSNEVRLNPDLMTSDRFDFQKAIGQPAKRTRRLYRLGQRTFPPIDVPATCTQITEQL